MNINATLLGQAIAFIIFVMFCMKYVWPPLINIIEQRQKEIADELALIQNEKKELISAQTKVTNSLIQAKKEASIIIEQAEKRYMQILNTAKCEAEKESERIILQAQAKINLQYKQLREQLNKELVMLVITATEKVLEQSLDETTNKEIINKSLAQL
ncbi:F0F1 ATP synthase subunit B [Candidatus Ishikawella capsulata]|uniref:ATP synthase subunit b n=1 Tax=Candidatus Ishikawaella capsulata Mpkobe TaxID=476281 RepID=C5WC21_9ENTR|nr:F0F1 ATP synthase subunit B [Candidatus Ishikawaella capsulata]BAH82877.1 F0F1 ATP synthase subunit B [Candidatus Ishikawaella capsulata Mpkobe]